MLVLGWCGLCFCVIESLLCSVWAHEHQRYPKFSIENRLQWQLELSTYGVIKKVGINSLCWGLNIDEDTPSAVTAAAPHLLLFLLCCNTGRRC